MNGKLIGEAAELLNRPEHQVRRAFDDLWPNQHRLGRIRVVPADRLCELAVAIEQRFSKRQAVKS